MIREKFGEDVKNIYASLTSYYTYKDSVKNICYNYLKNKMLKIM